jgi:hypothetical protein
MQVNNTSNQGTSPLGAALQAIVHAAEDAAQEVASAVDQPTDQLPVEDGGNIQCIWGGSNTQQGGDRYHDSRPINTGTASRSNLSL